MLIMSSKNQFVRDIVCKNHSARSERELYHICPSKLSKRELEDLYFALLENNLELKRAFNEQREQIKVLSTKVHRMTAAQRRSFNQEQKDCCVNTKALVSEQRESIADLKRANERMSERIRALNVRLCSAKQFARLTPLTPIAPIAPRTTTPATTLKNSSTSALNTKESELNVTTVSVSCQYLDEGAPSTPTAETGADEREKGASEKCCDQSECTSTMEELKRKIVDLQEELASSREEYSSRAARLERRVAALRVGGAEELATQLSIERRKVSELEMQLKAARLSAAVADTIGRHLADLAELKYKELEEKSYQSVDSSPVECDEFAPMMEGQVVINDKKLRSQRVVNEDCSTLNSVDEGIGCATNQWGEDPGMVAGTSRDISSDHGCHTPRDSNEKCPSTFTDKPQEKIQMNIDDRHNRFQIPGPITTSSSIKDMRKNNVRSESLDTSKKNNKKNNIVAETVDIPVKDKLYWNNDNANDKNSNNANAGIKKLSEMYSVNKLKDHLPNKNNAHNKHTIIEHIGENKKIVNTRDCRNEVGINNESEDKITKIVLMKSGDRGTEGDKNVAEFYNGNELISNLTKTKDTMEVIMPISYENNPSDIFLQTKHGGNLEIGSTDIPVKTNLKQNVAQQNVDNALDILEISSQKNKESDGTTKSLTFVKGCILNTFEEKSDIVSPSVRGLALTMNSGEDNRGQMPYDSKMLNAEDYNKVDSMVKMYPRNGRSRVDAYSFGGLLEVDATPAKGHNNEELNIEQAKWQASPVRSNTFTVDAPLDDKLSRRDADTDTDGEISRLADLPAERDEGSPRGRLSPGEDDVSRSHRSSSSYSSYSSSRSARRSLSAGELPTVVPARHLSSGEQPIDVDSEHSTPVKTRAPGERTSGTAARAEPGATPFALGGASPRATIDGTAPECTFTLHIGTVVLSEEAVVWGRDAALQVSWQWYEGGAGGARLPPARRVPPTSTLHLSTHYRLHLTDRFLHYMAHESLQIALCCVGRGRGRGRGWVRVAGCAAPLLAALLRAPRRARASLPLMRYGSSGPGLGQGQGQGPAVGVLDLWCRLRAPPRLLIAIRRCGAGAGAGAGAGTFPAHASDELAQASYACRTVTPVAEAPKIPPDAHPFVEEDYYERQRSQSGIMVNEVPTNIKSTEEMKQALERNVLNNLHPITRVTNIDKSEKPRRFQEFLETEKHMKTSSSKASEAGKKSVGVFPKHEETSQEKPQIIQETSGLVERPPAQSVDITVLWLALNEECEAGAGVGVGGSAGPRLYVAYSFLGRRGALLETPLSLPRPTNYADKCHFNFKRTFQLHDNDLPLLGHLARCRHPRVGAGAGGGRRNCVVFTVVSEPPEDPLGLETCEDVGYAYLYLGDVLAYSGASTGYTEVVPVVSARDGRGVCGVLAVRLEGLGVVRHCLALSP